MSQNTILEEEEADYDCKQLKAMVIRKTNHNKVPLINEYTVQNNVDGMINNLLGSKFEQESTIDPLRSQQKEDGTTRTNKYGQGDTNNINRSLLVTDKQTSVTVKINFAFYAKLVAFLLTINTIMFFKTFVLPNIFSFFDK